jgi:hypothetical protein
MIHKILGPYRYWSPRPNIPYYQWARQFVSSDWYRYPGYITRHTDSIWSDDGKRKEYRTGIVLKG